jgi:hypothetical protein
MLWAVSIARFYDTATNSIGLILGGAIQSDTITSHKYVLFLAEIIPVLHDIYTRWAIGLYGFGLGLYYDDEATPSPSKPSGKPAQD